MRSKCAWRGLSWKWFDQSAMGTLSCALSVPGVASVGSGLIRAQWVSLSEPGVVAQWGLCQNQLVAQWGLCHAL